MVMRILIDAQHSPNKQRIKSWRFGRRAPYIDRKFPDDPDNNFLFRCKVKGCGSTEFESMGGGLVQCESCQEEYVVEWDNTPAKVIIKNAQGFGMTEAGEWTNVLKECNPFDTYAQAKEEIERLGLEDCKPSVEEYL